MGTFWHDTRCGFRMLARNPAYASIMVLTLGLGIGATTAIFSMVNGVLLRPLRYPQSDRLVCVQEIVPAVAEKYPALPVNGRHFLEWRQRCSSFKSLSLIEFANMDLTGRDEPERLESMRVSANLFDTLGGAPALGRTFLAEEQEDARHHVVVISDGLWRRGFNADPSILDTAIMLDSEPYQVIGVLPAGFDFPNLSAAFRATGLIAPAHPAVFTPKVFSASERNELMGMFNFAAIARLKDGVAPDEATAELNVIAAQLVKMAGTDMELRATVKPLKEAVVEPSQRGLTILLAAVGAGLLIACLNLANFGLIRAERCGFDSALRAALGASRFQLLRQALTETVLISLLGAVLGVIVAMAGLGTLIRMAPSTIPRLDEVRIDRTVLFFALAVTVATVLLSGLLPAWRRARGRPGQVLAAGRHSASSPVAEVRLRSGLVTAEVGLGVMLLITAGLLCGSFGRLMRGDKGFHAPAVLAADIAPPAARYAGQKSAFHARLLDSLASAPGVRSAALVSALPLEGEIWVSVAFLPGDARPIMERPIANVRFVSANYFETMGIPLLAGRTFGEADRSHKVVLISRRLADMLWPDQKEVVGRRFVLGDGDQECEVVGVAHDVRANADQAAVAMLYLPYWDNMAPLPTVIVARAAGDPFSIAGSLCAAVRRLDPDLPLSQMRTMHEVLEKSVSQRRFQMLLAAAFAVCALVLSGFGIYAVVSYSVVRRTREIGIRTAFGALPLHLYRLVLRQGMGPVALGLILGVPGAVALGRLLRSLLYEISPYDPWIIAAAVAVTFTVALAACWLPARRAARTDPNTALRYE
jgi:predicted permease